MDVCLNSLLPAGKKALVVNNGAYSARAVAICRAYGLAHIDLRFSVEDVPDLKAVERALADDPDIALVYTTHHETGTGVLNPVREIGALAHAHGAAFVVDTTSTYAMLPFSMEEANIDFCMASAQKGLQAMTGLSFVIGRTSLIEASKAYPVRSYYCNLYQQYAYFEIYCTQGCGHAERRDGVKPWQSTVPMKMIPGKANPFSCTDPEAGNCRCV